MKKKDKDKDKDNLMIIDSLNPNTSIKLYHQLVYKCPSCEYSVKLCETAVPYYPWKSNEGLLCHDCLMKFLTAHVPLLSNRDDNGEYYE